MSLMWRDSAVRHVGAVFWRVANSTLAADRRTVDKIRIRQADGTAPADLIQVYQQGIRLSATPDSASGFSTSKTGSVSTNFVTVNVAGGTAPYTHSWAADGDFSAANPTAASTFFTGTPDPIDGQIIGDAIDTVTDANGVTNSIDVPVIITREAI